MLIGDEKVEDALQRKYAGKALESVRGSINLIGDLGTLMQAKEAKGFQDIDLNRVVTEVIQEFSLNPYKKVTFKYTPGDSLTARANPLLKEVFVNLVGNSIKYSGESVEIGITVGEVVEGDKEFYRVCIEDNGDGIPDEKKQVLFRRFERGTRKVRGEGLGLYIVKMLVEKYGGRVWIEDRVKGDHASGARFCFTIPKAAVSS